MNTLAVSLVMATVLACAWLFKRYRGTQLMANTYNAPNAGTNDTGHKTMLADAAIARYVFVISGTDEDHVAKATGATVIPLGVSCDEATAAEDNIDIALLGAVKGTLLITAGAAIAVGAHIQATTNGLAITLASTGYRAGRALQAAQASGDIIEFIPCMPESLAMA